MKHKIIRITTVPISLGSLLKGQMKYMSKFYEVIGVSSYGDGQLDEVGKKENIKVIPVEMTRKISPVSDLIAVLHLYKIFIKERPSIVHTHTPKAGTAGMLAAKLARVPIRLHTIAGLPLVEATGPKRILLNFVEKITYSCATAIYPNSNGLSKIILDNNFTKAKKLKVLGYGSSNGINTEHFDPALYSKNENLKLKDELKISETDFVFVFVGRLVKDKGINELISAFKDLLKYHSNAKLLLVGGYEKELDPLKPETEDFINNCKNIISVGWKNDVRPFFAISDILVFPSYREGFPNVVMQAGAMGLKSIVSDINGCNEIIKQGENGIIIPPKNSEALKEAMLLSIENKIANLKNPEDIREMIVSRFDQQFIWKELKKQYDLLLEKL